MRQAYVIMSKWLSRSGIFKELSGATRGGKTGRGQAGVEEQKKKEDGALGPFSSRSAAEQMEKRRTDISLSFSDLQE